MKRLAGFCGIAMLLAIADSGVDAQRAASGRAAPPAAAASAKPSGVTGELKDALQSGTFIEQNGEFKLNRTVTAAAGASDAQPVDFQVGTIDGKPAYVSVMVPKSSAATTEAQVWAAIPEANATRKPQIIQSCTPDSEPVCVQTRGDGSCSKYQCVPKKR